MKYSCSDCNYSTDDRRNWTRHIKSQKHLKKEQNDTNYLSILIKPPCQPNVNPCQPNVNPCQPDLSILVNPTCQPNVNPCQPDLSTLVNPTCQPNVNPTCQPNINPMSTQHQHDITSSANNNKPNISHSNDEFKFICLDCNNNFTTRQALSRHKKKSCSQNQKNDDLVTKLNEELKELKKRNDELENEKLKELKKQNEELKNDKEYLKNTTIEAVTAVKYSSAALKFVAENYPNTPLLKTMPDYLAIKKDCGGARFGPCLLRIL
jgi:hypothetical protein